ncbi:hypothetical protein SAMN05192565_107182 [Methylobacterium gossipiicola]|uniref:Uncharacterized protein n=1 Tax=Methylobacterium gossipiicola TaxID=582675 RepID=A0A1I2TKQ0_9HYPH|nr:hypothetical protein SAMN05192565_107182 [Methylobacterium gossipiicola]
MRRRRTPWQGRTEPNSKPTARSGKRLPTPVIDRSGFYGFRTQGLERVLSSRVLADAKNKIAEARAMAQKTSCEGEGQLRPYPALQKQGH